MKARLLTAAAVSGLLLVPATGAQAATATCDGRTATIVSSARTIKGTSGADVIVVRGKRTHTVYAGAGNDVVCGSRGRDVIYGGIGADTIIAGRGSDKVYGGGGNDDVLGGAGNDKIFGDGGADVLAGGTGNDQVSGGRGIDDIDGNDGADIVNGGSGVDVLHLDSDDVDHDSEADDVQDDSEHLALTAEELVLAGTLVDAATALNGWLATASSPGTGIQDTLPVDATTGLTTEQLASITALVKHVTWDATDDEAKGCVDGTVDPAGLVYFKVRVEGREGHDSLEHEASESPEYRVTRGTCAFTWDDEHGTLVPDAVATALRTTSGVAGESHGVTSFTSGSLADLIAAATVTGSGDVTAASAPATASETAVYALLDAVSATQITQIKWAVSTSDGGLLRVRACIVANDTSVVPNALYHQKIELDQARLTDLSLVWHVEAFNAVGDCSSTSHD